MTEETPQSEGEPSPAPDETPTAETKAFTYDDAVQDAGDEDDVNPPAGAAPAPEPDATQSTPAATASPVVPAAAGATTESDRPAGIFIPKWVGLVAAAVIAALVFGGIGYAIGDSSSDSSTTQNASNAVPGNGPFGRQLPGYGNSPFGDGQGQQPNGNGNGQTVGNGGFLGVGVQAAANGVEVSEVAAGSPAANAGIQKGDVITAIDGTTVSTPIALRAAVAQHSSGDQISVTYTRDGKSSTVKVTLTSRSAQSS